MKCPKCESKNIQTTDKVNVQWNEIYRQKTCCDCKHVFYTAEMEVTPNKRFRKEWNLYNKHHHDI